MKVIGTGLNSGILIEVDAHEFQRIGAVVGGGLLEGESVNPGEFIKEMDRLLSLRRIERIVDKMADAIGMRLLPKEL